MSRHIINLTVSGDNGHWLKLHENEYTTTLFSLSVHLSKLRQTSRIEQKHKDAGNSPIAWAEKWQCFKVAFQWHGNLDLDMKKFKGKFIIQFVSPRCPMKGIFVLFLNKNTSFNATYYSGQIILPRKVFRTLLFL